MSIFIVILIGIISILVSKHLFKKWFNPLSTYSLIWTIVVTLYELKFMAYVDLNFNTWLISIGAFLFFFFGILTVFVSRDSLGKKNDLNSFVEKEGSEIKLLADGGTVLKYALLITSFLGLLGALQHWYVLIQKFGSVANVLIYANLVYSIRVEGEIEGLIPYLYIFGYVAVFLSGIYTAHKNKFTFLSFLPLIIISLKEIASVGRMGLLFGLIEFITVFFLFRHLIFLHDQSKKKQSSRNFIIAGILLLVIFIGSASLVRSMRGSIESFKQSSAQLNKLKDNVILTPSIYLYFSAHIGVFSKYYEYQNEKALWGENTFMPIYNFLSKFDVIEHPDFYQKGYYVPMWTNTGTYLREVHSDFGNMGLIIVPYLLGFMSAFFWINFYEKRRTIYFVILVFINIIIGFSFLMMITRAAVWLLSFIFLLFTLPMLERLSEKTARSKIHLK
jgi:oligosaccharide repeat unit polymerase